MSNAWNRREEKRREEKRREEKRREECTQGLWQNLTQIDHLEGLDVKGIVISK
jgi:hypothetical protein